MSVAGYLSAGRPEVRMPRNCGDEFGARFEGSVLTGEKSVEEQIKGSGVRPTSEHYKRVEDYDPVLRAHLRI